MSAESVGQAFQNSGSFSGPSAFNGPLGGCANGENIHAVDFLSGHAESSSFAPNFRVAGGSVVGHPDRPLVVFNDKKDR